MNGLYLSGLLVDYCDVFISCLDSHSDGTHSLQSIHCWASDVMLHFSKSVPMKKKKSSTSWLAWGWEHFQLIFIFGWTIPFIFNQELNHIEINCCQKIQNTIQFNQIGQCKQSQICSWHLQYPLTVLPFHRLEILFVHVTYVSVHEFILCTAFFHHAHFYCY